MVPCKGMPAKVPPKMAFLWVLVDSAYFGIGQQKSQL
jgi:hypothetical protein